MTLRSFKISLSILCLSIGFLNQSVAQDGLWRPGVDYYLPHTNDHATYGGIQKVQIGTDGNYYALIRIDYSYDTSNGPSARRKRDHQGLGIPYAAWPAVSGTFLQTPLATISVSSDDGIPVNLKTFGNNTTQYIWIRATSQDATTVYFGARFLHIFTIGMRYSNDWLGLLWNFTAYNVLYADFFVNESFSKSNVTS